MKTAQLECTLMVPSRILAGTWQALQKLCHFPESKAIMLLPFIAVPM